MRFKIMFFYRFFIFCLLTWHLTFVLIQASDTSSLLCCPVQKYQNGVHVYCTSRSLVTFSWPVSADVSLNKKAAREICLVFNASLSMDTTFHTKPFSNTVVWLDVSQNSLTSFPELSHHILRNLQHLNLSGNSITRKLHDEVLKWPPSLRTLDLSFNRLAVIPELSASSFSEITFLDLSHNLLQELSSNRLMGLIKLETLNISHNQLTTLTSLSFAHLTSLNELQLSSNGLENLPLGIFDELNELLILNLSSNRLNSLEDRLFEHLANLKILCIRNNALSQLSPATFRSLSSLQTLDLNENRLTSIPGGIFDDLNKLTRLDFSKNELKSITKDTFSGLRALDYLDLSENNLTTIRKAAFITLHKLWWLSLRSNRLRKLHEHVFAGLGWLNVLDLSDNQLLLDNESLPPDIFAPLINLHRLHLQGNDQREEGSYPQQVFEPLTELRHLAIDTFASVNFDQSFALMTKLKTLHLPKCKVKILSEESFLGFTGSSLSALHLDACPVEEIEGCAFCELRHLEQISIINRFNSAVDPSTPFLRTQGNFIGPQNAALRRLILSNMQFHPDTIQSLADHTLKNLDELEVLDLSSNGLHGVNLTLKESVRQLFLSQNKFQSIPIDYNAHSQLALLDIRHNNISSLSDSARRWLDQLTATRNVTLLLKGNNLQCRQDNNCADVDFLEWLCTTAVILDVTNEQLINCNIPCTTEEGEKTAVKEALRSCKNRLIFRWTAVVIILCTSLAYLWWQHCRVKETTASSNDTGTNLHHSKDSGERAKEKDDLDNTRTEGKDGVNDYDELPDTPLHPLNTRHPTQVKLVLSTPQHRDQPHLASRGEPVDTSIQVEPMPSVADLQLPDPPLHPLDARHQTLVKRVLSRPQHRDQPHLASRGEPVDTSIQAEPTPSVADLQLPDSPLHRFDARHQTLAKRVLSRPQQRDQPDSASRGEPVDTSFQAEPMRTAADSDDVCSNDEYSLPPSYSAVMSQERRRQNDINLWWND